LLVFVPLQVHELLGEVRQEVVAQGQTGVALPKLPASKVRWGLPQKAAFFGLHFVWVVEKQVGVMELLRRYKEGFSREYGWMPGQEV
jgi:hypothetical protein